MTSRVCCQKKPCIEGLFVNVLGNYESCHLGNLYLMKDWECKGAREGQKGCYYGCNQIGTVTHNENIIAKRN